MKKSEKIRIIGLLIYVVASLLSIALIIVFHNLAIIITTILIIFLGYLCMAIIHSLTTHYNCPHCHKEFKINFIKDIFSVSAGRMGKKVKCPYCQTKTYMVDESN